MYSSIAKVAPDRKRTSHGIGKSGDELILSGQTDERAKDSIDKDGKASDQKQKKKKKKEKNPMPEKFAFHKQGADQNNDSDPSDQMRTIERPMFSQRDSRIKSAGRFELDTGWVELGYDEKKSKVKSREQSGTSSAEGGSKDDKTDDTQESLNNGTISNEKVKGNIYISFQSNTDDDDARKVKDQKAKSLSFGGSAKVKSNDESFQTGAEYFETQKASSSGKMHGSVERLSDAKKHKGTYDDVAPFHQSSEQQTQLKGLREQMHENKDGRTEIQRSITAVQTYKNKKEAMKRSFNKRFNREIENIKLENKTLGEDIDFWLIIKKKNLEDETEATKSDAKVSDKTENEDVQVSVDEAAASYVADKA